MYNLYNLLALYVPINQPACTEFVHMQYPMFLRVPIVLSAAGA